MAAGHKFYTLMQVSVSPDHRYVAYQVDTSGAENFTLKIKDLELNQLCFKKINKINDLASKSTGFNYIPANKIGGTTGGIYVFTLI